MVLLVKVRAYISDVIGRRFEKGEYGHRFQNWTPISEFEKGHRFENLKKGHISEEQMSET